MTTNHTPMHPLQNEEFINREISWLAFNERVLQEARDARVPLIERMRFLGIFSNNLDEFFRVRVASLRRRMIYNPKGRTDLNFTPEETLAAIKRKVVALQKAYNQTFAELEDELRKERIFFLKPEDLSEAQHDFATGYFRSEIRPNLVPIMLGFGNDFPELQDQSIYLAVKMASGQGRTQKNRYALIEVPDHLPRFVVLPSDENGQYVMFLEDIIRLRLRKLFAIFDPSALEAYTIKITRDAELDIDDDIEKSFVAKMQKGLDRRKRGEYVRFLYDAQMPSDLFDYLIRKMKIKDKENIIPGGRYHNRKNLMSFPDFGRKDLCFNPFHPSPHKELINRTSLLNVVKKRDILLHYPYQQFTNLVDLLREAAIDPEVKEIKINLYRVAKKSHIVNALENAARNGKEVTVVIELQARFDEKNNIKVAEKLQEAGAHIIFGVPGLKVHSKLMLITRREGRRFNAYAHIGTGNFHGGTANVYTDAALITADPRITREVERVFEFMEDNYLRFTFRHLAVSPYNTRRRFSGLIDREIEHAQSGKKAWITLKMNNLVDAGMIRKLYEASSAGVKVTLLIRGICSLIPGVKGMSENIEVYSIVGRYLEHSRIIVFGNDGQPEYFISSADWMTRNLDHRVEVSVPIYDLKLQAELQLCLDTQLNDRVKLRVLDRDLKNQYATNGKEIHTDEIDSQEQLYLHFRRLAEG
ncbi:MAG: polyphosphate kinase 1 [Flavobacteriales bacterium]